VRSEIRLAVLASIIREHGPILCVYVERYSPSHALYAQPMRMHEVEAGELRVREGRVVVAHLDGPLASLPQPTGFAIRADAHARARTVASVLRRIPCERMAEGDAITEDDAAAILARLDVTRDGAEVRCE